MDVTSVVADTSGKESASNSQRTRESTRQSIKRRKTLPDTSGGKSDVTKTVSKTPSRLGGRHTAATSHGALSRFDSSLGLLTRKFANLIQVSFPLSPKDIMYTIMQIDCFDSSLLPVFSKRDRRSQ